MKYTTRNDFETLLVQAQKVQRVIGANNPPTICEEVIIEVLDAVEDLRREEEWECSRRTED
jgi:hypothetical protein